jgi:hypothetical protein
MANLWLTPARCRIHPAAAAAQGEETIHKQQALEPIKPESSRTLTNPTSSTAMNETEHKIDLPWRRPCTNSINIRIQLPVKQIIHRATSSKTNCLDRSMHTVPAWEIVTGNNCIPIYSTTMTMIL